MTKTKKANTMTDFLLPYQKAWVLEESPFAIYLKSRRIGISWCEALWSVRRRITKRADHWFVSKKEQTAQEFVRYCKQFAEAFNIILRDSVIDLDGTSASVLTMPNGSRIVALTSNPDAIRGFGGDVTLDEFAFHQNQAEMYGAAQPVRMWGNCCLRIISSHNGEGTEFHKVYEGAKNGTNDFKAYKTTIVDAVNEGLAIKVVGDHHKHLPDVAKANEAFVNTLKRNALSDDIFAQEYMCEVMSSSNIILPEEYDGCVLANAQILKELPRTQKFGSLVVGIDIGRTKNLSVIWALQKGFDKTAPEHMREVYRTVATRELTNMPFQAQYQVMEQFVTHPNVQKVFIDAGGIGMQLSEDLWENFGNKVVKVNISHQSKARLVERVKKFVAQNRVSLPNDPVTRSDILAMRRVATKSGGFTYDGNSGDSHCDRFMALALALEAADAPSFRVLHNSNKVNDHG
jgi:phage FluMu gp28-like protein